MIEFGFILVQDGLNAKKQVNNQFSSDFEIFGVYVVGTQNGKIDGGQDNISIMARLDKDSVEIFFEDIIIELQTSKIQTITYKAGNTLDQNTYTYNYSNKGKKFKQNYINTDDVIELKFQLPLGYEINENDYVIINTRYIKKNTNVPIKFTMPRGMTSYKTDLYP
ncbi:MAG: hypothetical protein ACOC16_00085 [Nanoarchaeota archaeon]